MRRRALALAALALAPTLVAALPATGPATAQAGPALGERAFVLAMEDHRFNGQTWPDTPLLEAYAGETMRFLVHVPAAAETHTFHLHGHPWEHPDTGAFVDAVRLDAGETHRFTQTAGLEASHAGDWFYHCHVETHFEHGMWGLLRVYPYAVQAEGPLTELDVRLTDGETGLEGADLQAHLRDGQGPVRAAEDGEGDPVDVDVTELGEGRYRVSPQLAPGQDGQLVLTAQHARGESVARLDLTGDGYELARDVVPTEDGDLPHETLPDVRPPAYSE
jgi:uncharacterized cupredoxin-like copper-binding protein